MFHHSRFATYCRTFQYVHPRNPLGTDYARITTQNFPRATDTHPTETDGCEVRHDAASARTAYAPAAQLPHAPRAITRKETQKVQFLDLAQTQLVAVLYQ
jgi:hypothetical protein